VLKEQRERADAALRGLGVSDAERQELAKCQEKGSQAGEESASRCWARERYSES
jgi:hypothetical protein